MNEEPKMKAGVIYFTSYGKTKSYLFKCTKNGHQNGDYIVLGTGQQRYTKGGEWNSIYDWVEATPEQIAHFELCEAAGKYVEPPAGINNHYQLY